MQNMKERHHWWIPMSRAIVGAPRSCHRHYLSAFTSGTPRLETHTPGHDSTHCVLGPPDEIRHEVQLLGVARSPLNTINTASSMQAVGAGVLITHALKHAVFVIACGDSEHAALGWRSHNPKSFGHRFQAIVPHAPRQLLWLHKLMCKRSDSSRQ